VYNSCPMILINVFFGLLDDQLSTFLHDALSLCKILEVPLLNPGKIYAMVIWALKVQQLPLPVLVREKRIITSTLQNMISLELGGDIVKLDAFKVCPHLQRFISYSFRFNRLFIVFLNDIPFSSTISLYFYLWFSIN
jgi:hypothetical protein